MLHGILATAKCETHVLNKKYFIRQLHVSNLTFNSEDIRMFVSVTPMSSYKSLIVDTF